MPKQIEINNMAIFDEFKQTLFWPGRENLWLELNRLMLMLRYFSICFHIPLSNRGVSTYIHL